MIESLWYIAIASCALLILADWRKGLYFAVAVDCLRDPVRKLIESEPIGVTLSGAAIWALLVLVALSQESAQVSTILKWFPPVKNCLVLLSLAIVPAAFVSLVSFHGGWKLVAVGLVSYVVPLAGLAVGYLLAKSPSNVYGLFQFYSLINGLLLVGAPLEFFDLDVAGLGGMQDVEWIRHRPGYTVDLIAGFYRSPDIMGLHAAHVFMFAAALYARSSGATRVAWGTLSGWGFYCLLLCGRRKMIAMPLVFVATYFLLLMWRKNKQVGTVLGAMIISCCVLIAAVLLQTSGETDPGNNGHAPIVRYDDHISYASTLFTEGVSRSNDIIIGSTLSTLRQAGLLGGGLGVATQGRYYLNVQTSRALRGWQEDGVSRLFVELGVPGVLFLSLAGLYFFGVVVRALKVVPEKGRIGQQVQTAAFSIFIANLASYAASHQQYSGDPVSALIATILCGVVIGTPVAVFRHQQQAVVVPKHPIVTKPTLVSSR